MASRQEAHSWFGPPEALSPPVAFISVSAGFQRLWRGFMAVRILAGVVLLVLQLLILAVGQLVPVWLVVLSVLYLLQTIGIRWRLVPVLPVRALDAQWALTIGVDLLFFVALQLQQGGTVNYTPLLAMPVLLASVLGTITLALGTTAAVTILMLIDAWWLSLLLPGDAPGRFFQAALTGTGLFIVSFLANQLASRLAGEEQRSELSRRAAQLQTLVNELVIDNLTDGVLVVDSHGLARAANPAAQRLLGASEGSLSVPFSLWREPAWRSVGDLAMFSFERRGPRMADITIDVNDAAPVRVHLRTRLTSSSDGDNADAMCVIFMQDLREMEARVRTEKLAAMGRMSAAVAHEIRNPLAAIAQANALLDEDLSDPGQRQLTDMIRQNTQRLSRIVEEILDIARVQGSDSRDAAPTLHLGQATASIVADWCQQTGNANRLQASLKTDDSPVVFEAEHLRRVLVNLLDNAARYAGNSPESIVVDARSTGDGGGVLQVWSDGAPLEQAVQRHLFEPFFSSESRSSGLGLYICRELCERHAAVIGYERLQRMLGSGAQQRLVEGNAFFVTFRPAGTFDTITA